MVCLSLEAGRRCTGQASDRGQKAQVELCEGRIKRGAETDFPRFLLPFVALVF